jgi:hypothetical protein
VFSLCFTLRFELQLIRITPSPQVKKKLIERHALLFMFTRLVITVVTPLTRWWLWLWQWAVGSGIAIANTNDY